MMAERIQDAKLTEYKGYRLGFMTQARNPFIKDLLDFFALKRDWVKAAYLIGMNWTY